MPFINKVTVRGTTYYLENLTDGSNIVRLPKGISADDYFVTESTLGQFTVSEKELEDFKTEVTDNFNSFKTESSDKLDEFELEISGEISTFQRETTENLNKFKAEVEELAKYDLPVATNSVLGGVKAAVKSDAMIREVGIDADGKLWVEADIDAAKAYTDSKSYSVEIVDVLPAIEDAEDRTFYLIPKSSGKGYEKYWKITNTNIDEEGHEIVESQLDEFAGSSTEVVSELPVEGEIDVDYIVYDGNVCLYYKWISGNWCMVAGSVAKIVDTVEGEIGNEYTDYYVKNGEIYFHYRWDNETSSFVMVGNDSYNKTEIDAKISNINTYVNSTFATKEALDVTQDIAVGNAEKIEDVKSDIKRIDKTISEMKGDNENLIIQYNEVGSVLHLYERDENGEITIVDGDKEVKVKEIYSTIIVGGGGGGDALISTIKLGLNVDGDKDIKVLYGNTVSLDYILSTRKAKTVEDENGKEITVYEEAVIPGDITISLYKDNVYQTHFTVKKTELTAQKGSIDVTEYVSLGSQVLSLKATYVEQLGSGEETITVRAGTDWSVEAVNLKLIDLPDNQWETTIKTGSTTFYCTPVGDLEKKVYFQIDDAEPEIKVTKFNGTQMPYTIKMQSHGVHILRIWCTGEIGGKTISTDVYTYVLMFKESGNNTPIIRIKAPETLEQYSAANIYYNVVDPLNDVIDEVTIYDEDGTILSSVVNITSAEQTYEFKPTVAKNTTITVKYKDDTKSVNIDVTKFPYEISAVTRDLMLDFVPTGRTNSDADYNVFKNNAYATEINDEGEEIQKEIPMTWDFSDNFDWINGGWQRDEAGDTYFCVKAGTSVAFNYKLFENANTVAQKDANGNYSIPGIGKEFKIIFKTTNVARSDAEWLSCYGPTEDGYNAGIRMEVHNGYVSSNIGTLEIPYSEEDIIEFDTNIVPISEFSPTYEPQFTSKNIPMVLTYEDGTPVQPMVITSASTSFQQENAVPITIGSEYCDVHIYRMKVYDRYLTDKEILSNFIADARSGVTMAERYVRNDIYTADGQLDPETLAKKCPDLFVYVLSAPKFTNDKKDKVENTTIRQYKYDAKTNSWPIEYNWTATGAIHNGQGTSSNEYGYASRNLEYNMKKATITLGDNSTVVKKIQLSETSVPTNYLNLKVNVASSEHCNNALLQKRYDRYLPYTTLAAEKDDRVKNSMEFFNCVVFVQETGDETHREFSDKAVHFYAIGNIGDSKKTDDSRTNDPDDANEFCVEVMDWNRDLSTFPAETRLFAAHTIGYVKAEEEDLTVENLENLYEKVELPEGTSYEKTSDGDIDPSTTYYVKTETIKYIDLLKPENCGENGIVYEKNASGELVHCMDTVMDFTKDYYVDVLEGDDFSEDYTYGFRYIQKEWDEKDGADYKEKNETFQKPLRQKWVEFYRFVTRDLTTNGKEDKAKVDAWKKEFEDWFILDSALYYYLYTLRYTMVDNRAKNSFYHYGKCPDGKYRFEFWAYDMDTALGIDNAGKLDIPFGQEDHDVDDAGAAHFRAHNSTFFDRIATYFAAELNTRWAAIEQSPMGNAFDSTSLLNEFDAWQEQFAEELWRLDYERKYKRTYVCGNGPDWDNALPKKNEAGANVTEPRFLKEMMNGRKKYQRRQFERAQDTYMSSKFLGSKNVSDTITLRGAGASETHTIPANYTLSIVPFTNMYVNIHDGTTNFYHNRCYAGQTYNIDLLGASGAFDFGYIRGSSNIQELGDLSLKYLQTATLNSGSRLKTIKLGNADERYENKSLKTLAIGSSNRLLEELDIRNLKYLANESLDLPVTNIPSLKRVYAQGSNIRQARFANNGLLEEAYLPGTVTELSLRNLHFIKTIELESYDSLVNLTVENCPTMNDKVLVMIGQAKNLKSVKVTNINWEQKSTDLLNRIVKMKGSLITGFVKFTEYVRQSELDAYAAAWPDLEVDINEATLVPQYPVAFFNYDGVTPILDKNGNPYVQLVDEFKSPYDPTEKDPNTPIDIDIPVREETAQYKYVFTGWDGIKGAVPELTRVVAMYMPEDQHYNVYWHNKNGDILYTLKDVKYGDSAVYGGNWPTYTANETEYYEYSIFTGWDISTSVITGETHVYAVYETVNGLPANGTKMKDMSVAQIYSIVASNNSDNYFNAYDYVDIQFGNDYSYSNVDEHVVISDSVTLDGTESKVIETDTKLCGADSPAFTIAIDFEFTANEISGKSTLVSCFEYDNSKGLRLFYGTDGNPTVQWGDQTMVVGYGTQRNMVVIRHAKGSETVHVYAFNSENNSYSTTIKEQSLTRTTQQFTDRPVMIGGFRYDPEAGADIGNIGGLCKGTVHWVKIWNEDLGDTDAKNLAAWPHETIRFRCCENVVVDGTTGKKISGRYDVNPATGRMTGASFICENLLSYGYHINLNGSNVGGWAGSEMREFCNSRVYNAFPTVWKSIIKNPYISANNGDASYSVVTQQDYIYIPSYIELNAKTTDPYNKEGSVITSMTNSSSRIKRQNGIASKYWTRSAEKYVGRNYWGCIAEDGSVGTYTYAYPYYKYGICPCFSI